MTRLFAVFGLVVALSGCAGQPSEDTDAATPNDNVAAISDRLAARVPDALAEYKVAGVGMAVIEEGKVALTAYYGEQGPEIPSSKDTVFNTASVAKTLTAETLIALASENLIDLDAPIASLVENEDLQTDPRFQKLTPRLNMSHRAGLLNWPHVYEDGTASFVAEPGEGFYYSGMAVEMAAEYAEAKLGKDFEALAFEHVLDPAGIADMSMGRLKPWMTGRLATPMDREGNYFDLADGDGRLSAEENATEWSAADDLMTTVEAYAVLIVSLLSEEEAIGAAQTLRTEILTSLSNHDVWGCQLEAPYTCANEYGHSIGWMVYKYDDHTIIKHGGNDAGENALVLYSPETRDGAVILANGGNGVFVTTEILGLIGHEPDMAAYYRALVGRFFGTELPTPPQELAD
ncbi:MAG: serine hydrolase domain-containing protein [Pseudomonadota bacterium]